MVTGSLAGQIPTVRGTKRDVILNNHGDLSLFKEEANHASTDARLAPGCAAEYITTVLSIITDESSAAQQRVNIESSLSDTVRHPTSVSCDVR